MHEQLSLMEASGAPLSRLIREAGRLETKRACAVFALRCAERVAHLNKHALMKTALMPARAWLADPTERNRAACRSAANAIGKAKVAGRAKAASSACSAVHSALRTASAVGRNVRSYSYADAAWEQARAAGLSIWMASTLAHKAAARHGASMEAAEHAAYAAEHAVAARIAAAPYPRREQARIEEEAAQRAIFCESFLSVFD